MGLTVFDWDAANLRKIRKHGIRRDEAERALMNDPILIYDQLVDDESRFVYYGETDNGRLRAVIATERGEKLRL